MSVISTLATAISVNDVIDLNGPLRWLRDHRRDAIALAAPLACVRENASDVGEGPLDELAVAFDIAALDYAVVTAIANGTHSVSGAPVVTIRNSIYDIVVPASLIIPRITT